MRFDNRYCAYLDSAMVARLFEENSMF